MMTKLIVFIIFASMAAGSFIAANNSDYIVCSNKDSECYVRHVNPVMNDSSVHHKVSIDKDYFKRGLKKNPKFSVGEIDGDITKTISYGGQRQPYFSCHEIRSSQADKYRLVSKGRHSSILTTYKSRALCEIDLQIVDNYLHSNNQELLKYKRPSGYLNFLWYIGTAIFSLLAVLVLFGKTVSKDEIPQHRGMSEEQMKNFANKVSDVTKTISDFDSDITKKIQKASDKINKFNIDIDKDK